MPVMYNINLGRWESFFAKRIMTKGPDELMRICAGKSPLFNAVVKYKWHQDPFVKNARAVARRLRVLKFVDKASYSLVKATVLKSVRDVEKNEEVYREFLSLIEYPGFNKRFNRLIDDVFAFNSKLNDVSLKLFDRIDELESYGLLYNADYEKGGSKKLDLVSANMSFQWLLCKIRFPFEVKYAKQFCQTLFSEIVHGASLCLFPGEPRFQEYCQKLVWTERYMLNECQNALDSVDESVAELFEEQARVLDKKYADMARYKDMIATKQLAKFQKE